MDAFNNEFFEKLASKLQSLPTAQEASKREESWMTAEEIQKWSGIPRSPAEIEQALLHRWQRAQLGHIRPAKYPHQDNLSRLWGHIERVRPLDKVHLEPFRLDAPLELEPLELPPGAPQLFISFCSLDLELAIQVRQSLAEQGIYSWLYLDQIKTGDTIFEAVRAGMNTCFGLIGLLTRTSIGSAWVSSELQTGLEIGKSIFAVFDAGDEELMRLLEDWKPDQPIKRDNSLIDPLEESYSQKAPQRHAGGYRDGVWSLFTYLAKYSSRVFYPKRPTGWLGDKDFIDFQTMVDRICPGQGAWAP